jgi:branched-chain amino acid aminotransferase
LLDASAPDDAIVRVILTRGGRRLCLMESSGDREQLSSPASLLPVTYNPSTLLDGVKSLSYAANMLASRLAEQAGFDEALLVRSDHVVLEAPTSSIFWAVDGILRTPAVALGILASITRGLIVDAMAVEEGAFPLGGLLGADEAFLASTGRDAQPIARIRDTYMRSAPGPMTLEAQNVLRRALDTLPSRPATAAESAGRPRQGDTVLVSSTAQPDAGPGSP